MCSWKLDNLHYSDNPPPNYSYTQLFPNPSWSGNISELDIEFYLEGNTHAPYPALVKLASHIIQNLHVIVERAIIDVSLHSGYALQNLQVGWFCLRVKNHLPIYQAVCLVCLTGYEYDAWVVNFDSEDMPISRETYAW